MLFFDLGWRAERRWRDAAWFGGPVLALAAWMAVLFHSSGYWSSNSGFEQYNLFFRALHPLRLLVAISRRFYSLFVAEFSMDRRYRHRLRLAPLRSLFRSRSWKIAWWLVATHIVTVTMLGGAVLTRYLLPIMPIVYAAMAVGIWSFPRRLQLVAGAALLVGLGASNFINPPYPFPYEDNLAFADFVKLQTGATAFLNRWFADARITTVWPLTRELERPELGFVSRKMQVQTLRNLTPQTLAPVDWQNVEVFVAFSRTWDPEFSFTHFGPIRSFWQHFYGFTPNTTMDGLRARVPFPVVAHFERRGQWLDIYVNPKTPLSSPAVRAMLADNPR